MKTNITYEKDGEWGKCEKDFDLIISEEERKKFKPIIQSTDKNCSLCALEDETLNFLLFYKQAGFDELKHYLLKHYNYNADEKELLIHRAHIENVINEVKELKNTNKIIDRISKINNEIEDVERLNAEIIYVQNEMSKCDKQSKTYVELVRCLTQLINIKNDITKGKKINLSVESVDDLIDKLGKQ